MPTASASPKESTAARPRGRVHRRSPLLLLAAILVAASLTVVSTPRPVAAAPATTTSDLNLRSGPGTNNPVILVMPPGATVEIVGGPQNGFYQLTYNGTTGWASGDYLDQSGGGNDGGNDNGGSGSGTATVTSSLNLRAGPSTGDQVLAVMPAGATVTLTGNAANGFVSVTYSGTAGWAFAEFLSSGGNPAPPPAPSPSPSPAPNPGGGGTATVTTGLNLRSGPGTNNSVITVMPAGATVTLTGNSANGFLSVSYNGIAGWAAADFLSTSGGNPAPAPSPSPSPSPGGGAGTATVTTGLNLRSGPGTNNSVITVMPAGASVTLTGNNANGFLSVRYNGIDGWASSDYLNTGGGNPAPSPSPSPSPSPGGGSATTTTALNLRAGPGTNNPVLTVMPAGVAVSITGTPQNGFHPISYAGQSGWASSSFLSFGSGSTPGPAPNPAPGGGSGIAWPFSGGTWEVVQGYNAYTHQNRGGGAQYYYALDFARVGGATAGQAIYSPVTGTIRWTHAASGGILIDIGNGYMVAMFHCTFSASLRSGQTVQQGQYLGTISGPGGPGYAVTPHLDITLWRSSDGGFSRTAAPFSGANAIGGVSFPDVGGFNQHYGTRVTP